MFSESSPAVILIFLTAVLLNTLILGWLLALFQPGERGYFARNGQAGGWATCLGVTLVLNLISLAPVPLLVPAALWWAFALGYLGLTVRQTLKLNLAMGLIVLGLVLGIAAVLE